MLCEKAASSLFPKHAAVAGWKTALSFVEQEGLPPMPKNRGSEQGDVDGLVECILALGAEAKPHVAAQQAARTLSWIGRTATSS